MIIIFTCKIIDIIRKHEFPNQPFVYAIRLYNASIHSLHLAMICLKYKPSYIACMCIHLACKWSGIEVITVFLSPSPSSSFKHLPLFLFNIVFKTTHGHPVPPPLTPSLTLNPSLPPCCGWLSSFSVALYLSSFLAPMKAKIGSTTRIKM